ncbi:MAG: hypothetical protein Q7V88_12600 [Actinomycetota bacterium]|nr:hypothetical protein [Actinomycetota bacterium]
MQPGSAAGATGGSSRQLKRWGPIAGVLAVIAVGVVVLVVTSGDDDKTLTAASTSTAAVATTPASTAPGAETTAPGTSDAPAEISYPLSYSQAVEQGVADQIEWGDRCDTTSGRLAVPDYFAPECMAPFSGDNGGSTATGVTADEITLVYYEGQALDPIIAYITDAIAVDDTNADQFATMKELVRYYEAYYELYGRKINLVTYEGTGNAQDEVAARADAAAIADKYSPFAVLGGPALTSAFADELARRQVLCIGCTPGQPADFYTERDPYVWGLDGSALQKQTHVLEFIEKQLLGKNAEHGGAGVQSQPRTFGLVYLQSSGASKDLADTFAAEMDALGAPFAAVSAYDLATIQQTASQVIASMKAAGVTTIVFSGDPVAPRDFTREATAQEYFPEWLVAASTLVDVTAFARTYDQQQWQHAFGVTQLAARSNPTTSGAYANYTWFTGQDPPADDTINTIAPNPALFFAVVQQAGPNLTPESFRDAAFASRGTVPGISQPYLTYGDKGYWGGVPDYQGVDDATVFWWDAAATGADEIRREGTGMYQYVDGGQRYLPGEWPTDEKLFDPEGALPIYTTPPAGEERGDYPSPA